jgi:hypothetical protein
LIAKPASVTARAVGFVQWMPQSVAWRPMLVSLHTIDGGIDKHPVSSLPGRSSERAKTGNQYQGSANDSKVFLETASANCHF